jgi:hypothetical protein
MSLLAVWLFRDANTFALRGIDRESGRGRGCYTDIEMMLGLKSPTDWVRPSEFILSLVFGIFALRLMMAGRNDK